MNWNKKSLVALFLMLMLSVGMFAGCGTKDSSTGDGDESTSGEASTSEGVKDTEGTVSDSSEEDAFYEFEVYWNYGWYNPEYVWDENNLIAKHVKDLYNVGIQWSTPGGDADQKLNLMTATNEFPDVIVMDRSDSWLNLIEMGALLPLDDYIAEYEGVRGNIDEATLNMLKVDGKIYGIPNWAKTPDFLGGNGGYLINEQIYEELGSPALTTLDDLYEYLKLVKESGIEVEGKTVIPLQMKQGDSLDGLSVLWTAYGEGRNTKELISNKVRPQGDKLVLTTKDDKFDDFMVYMNKLYTEGLMNQDYFIETQEQINEKLALGRVAVYVSPDATSQGSDAMQALTESGSKYSYKMIEPMSVEGIAQEDIYTSTASTLGWNVVCITKDAADPERIYEYFDWAITPEGNTVLGFGPEGIIWNGYDENGYPIIDDGADFSTRTPELPYGKFLLPGNTKFFDGAKMHITSSSGDVPWDIESQMRVSFNHTLDITDLTNIMPPTGSEEADVIIDTEQYMKEQYTKMIAAADGEDEVLEILNETIEEIERRGFNAVEDYMTDAWLSNLAKIEQN